MAHRRSVPDRENDHQQRNGSHSVRNQGYISFPSYLHHSPSQARILHVLPRLRRTILKRAGLSITLDILTTPDPPLCKLLGPRNLPVLTHCRLG